MTDYGDEKPFVFYTNGGKSDAAGVSCRNCSQAGVANWPMKLVGNLLLWFWSGTDSFHLAFHGCRHVGSVQITVGCIVPSKFQDCR